MTVKANFKIDFKTRSEFLSPFSCVLHLKGFEKLSPYDPGVAMENEGGLEERDEDVSSLLYQQICDELGFDERDFTVFRYGAMGKEYIVKCRTGEAYTMLKLVYAGI